MILGKWRRIVGILILLISLAILAWGFWPYASVTRSVPIQPADLQLPTPESFIWLALHTV